MKFEPVRFFEIDQGVHPRADGVLRRGGGEADGDPRRRIGIAGRVAAGRTPVHGIIADAPRQGIVARQPRQRVITGTAGDAVVAGHAVQNIGAGVARQGVVEVRTGQVLEIGEGIAPRPDRVLGGALMGEADRHGTGGIGIAGRVAPGSPAVHDVVAQAPVHRIVAYICRERIVSRGTDQAVIAGPAAENIGIGVAGQGVVEVGPAHILDIGERVDPAAARVLCRALMREVDDDAGGGLDIICCVAPACTAIHDVIAQAAIERVVPHPARQVIIALDTGDKVIAGAAHQHVVGLISQDPIVAASPDGVLDERARVVVVQIGVRDIARCQIGLRARRHPDPPAGPWKTSTTPRDRGR